MTARAAFLEDLLDRLEGVHGPVVPGDPLGLGPAGRDAASLVLHANCGYPPSEARCRAGWLALAKAVGTTPGDILGARRQALERALAAGGAFPPLRAQRLRAIARAVVEEHQGDLQGALLARPERAAAVLRRFPTIGVPGADKVLLFAGISPVAAVPSPFVLVPLRLGLGEAQASYAANYRAGRQALDAALPRSFRARQRAYVLLARHGRDTCLRTGPRCGECVLAPRCPGAERSAARPARRRG